MKRLKHVDAAETRQPKYTQGWYTAMRKDEPGRRSSAKLLTKDEARRIAVNMAKLPQLLLGF